MRKQKVRTIGFVSSGGDLKEKLSQMGFYCYFGVHGIASLPVLEVRAIASPPICPAVPIAEKPFIKPSQISQMGRP